MRFWCNIQGLIRPLCPQTFGAIGSGVPSCRCLVYVGLGAREWEFQVSTSPPLYNRAMGMHSLLLQHTWWDKNPLSKNLWSDRVRRSELPLPCVRRPGTWEWEFQVETSPPPTIARWACMRFWCNIQGRTRPLCPQNFGAIGSGVPSFAPLPCVRRSVAWTPDF